MGNAYNARHTGRMRRWLALLPLLALGLLGSAQARTLAAPIVGTWNFAHGTVKVTAAGNGFVGTVTQPALFRKDQTCPHPVGEQIWKIQGKEDGGHPAGEHFYGGTALTFGGIPCSVGAPLGASFKVLEHRGGRPEILFCSYETLPSEGYPDGCAHGFGPPAPRTGGRASFAFAGIPGISQSGPTLGPGYRFTSATGDVAFKGTKATVRAAIVFSYHYSNGPTRKVGIRVVGVTAKPDLTGSVKSVVFRIAVHSSELPGCTAGQRGTLRLSDAGVGDDGIILTICGRTRSYALGQKQPGTPRISSLAVSIRPD
jgi:hypothetical protein